MSSEVPAQVRVLIRSIIEEVEKEYGQRIKRLEQTLTQLARRIDEIESYVQTVYAKTLTVSLATVVREAFQYNVSQLENKIANTTAKVVREDISHNINELARHMVELEDRVQKLNQSLEGINRVLEKCIEGIGVLGKSVSDLRHKIDEVESSVEEKISRIDNILASTREQVEDISTRFAEFEHRFNNVANAVVELHDAILEESNHERR